jgi:pimeloyl-ACP methyl ester carboxylesterase
MRLDRAHVCDLRTASAILVAAPLLAALPGTASAEAGALGPCEASPSVLCGAVEVPIDRSGEVPGRISLHVEKLPAPGAERGVLFLLAGGPGQGATRVFDLRNDAERLRALFPGYTLVAFDPRGTGQSGQLRCQGLGEPGTDFVREMASCAQAIGPAVSFYATRDHAEDVETVRAALGVQRIALFGASYGAKLAVAYALAHRGNVERVVLDSPLPAKPDTFGSTTLRSLPRALRSLCAGDFCRGVTANLSVDLPALANALEKKPLKSGSLTIDGEFLLSLAMGADVDSGVRAQLPTAVAEARRARPRMLLRLAALNRGGAPDPTFSFPLYVATTCRDGTFPWQPETSLADREVAYRNAVDALPPRATGPFGRWAAAQAGIARFCSFWPPSGPGAPLAAGPAPNVPVLVLSGGHDMRTPTESARTVAGLFRRASLIVVPGVGHTVLSADISGCGKRALATWLGGDQPAASCSRVRPVLSAVGSLAAPTGVDRATRVRRTLAAVAATLRSAASAWYAYGGGAAKAGIAGLHGGRLETVRDYRFSLERFSDVRGVRLSGQLDVVSAQQGSLIQLQGNVKVATASGIGGVVTVSEGRLSGALGRAPASIRVSA